MAPGQNHHVEVAGALEGVTVVDAMRFVSAGTSAPGINYVHTDHLGTPQKMADATKAIVWDAVYTPFGQVHSITGTATNNQRFPGKYADAETGYSYNYFRDYDPTTGRYIQNDPVDTQDGLNRYAYVGNSPTRFVDRLGLIRTTGELANPKDNTIVCDGNGGIMLQVPDSNFDSLETLCGAKDCVKAHERSHFSEADVRNPGVCKNRPAGAQVFFSHGEQQDSEYKAYSQQIRCLKQKSNRAQCACKSTLSQAITNAQKQQARFKP
ncbi:MAG: RHS repeat-associated core domain-containing protein [Nitrospirales bacterium]